MPKEDKGVVVFEFLDWDPEGIKIAKFPVGDVVAVWVPKGLERRVQGIPSRGAFLLLGLKDKTFMVSRTVEGLDALKRREVAHEGWDVAVFFLVSERLLTEAALLDFDGRIFGVASRSPYWEGVGFVEPEHAADRHVTTEKLVAESSFLLGCFGVSDLLNAGAGLARDYLGETKAIDAEARATEEGVFHIRKEGVFAFGTFDGKEFTVLEGSEVRLTKSPYTVGAKRRRAAFIESGILQVLGNGFGVMTEDKTFPSASCAADFVIGRGAPGRKMWLDRDGKTLGEIWPRA